MQTDPFYSELLTDHNLHPLHKHPLPQASHTLKGVNPSCGDHLLLQLQLRDGRIAGGAFVGEGCAVSQASADIMLDLVAGKTTEEALLLSELFLKMIQGQATPQELEQLQEAAALQQIAHMPARVKCAVLGWRTLQALLREAGPTP